MNNWLWLAVAVCLGVSLTPWGPLVLYPFTLFTTWVHECGHAVMTVLVGGSVGAITIQPNTSGLTRSLVPASRIAQGMVASAGVPIGASLVGCLLTAATRQPKRARPILWGIGAFMLFTLVFWMRNLFGALVVLGWGVVLLALARKDTGRAPRFVLSLLAVQVALNAVYDIRICSWCTADRMRRPWRGCSCCRRG